MFAQSKHNLPCALISGMDKDRLRPGIRQQGRKRVVRVTVVARR